jgi:H+/Cl- antiporter ClcA
MATQGSAKGREEVRLVLWGALIGIPAALVAALFVAAVHELEDVLWDDLPDALGHSSPPWYLVLGLPLVGAVVVILARRFLPGDGGHPPLVGLAGGATPPAHAPGVLLAALGTLGFGAVLGPEAPIIALGSAVGALITSRAKLADMGPAVMAGAGSFAAVSALFGGPLVGGVLLLEAGVGLGAAVVPALVPGFVAAAVGYVLFVGLGNWGGLNVPGLTVPDLPQYDGTRIADLVLAIAVGVATAITIAVARRLAERVDGLAPRWGMAPLLLAGGLAVGVIAQSADWLGASSQEVLFSGQASVPDEVAATSARVLAVLLVCKVLGYAVSLGCGFRGGPIFPAVFLGVGFASLAVVWFDSSPTWAVAVGAAAGMAAESRLLVAPMVFGTILVGTSGLDAAPAMVLGAVTAWLAAAAIDQRVGAAAGGAAPATS